MLIIVAFIWVLLMARSVAAEYRYYHSVKYLEPEIWSQLGSPSMLKSPIVFISVKGSKLLHRVSNAQVLENAQKHHKAGRQFLLYVVLVLIAGIVFLKTA